MAASDNLSGAQFSSRLFTSKQIGRMGAGDFGGPGAHPNFNSISAAQIGKPTGMSQSELTHDIGDHGIAEPVKISHYENDSNPTLVNGHHRALAARETDRKVPGVFRTHSKDKINNWLGRYTPPKG